MLVIGKRFELDVLLEVSLEPGVYQQGLVQRFGMGSEKALEWNQRISHMEGE